MEFMFNKREEELLLRIRSTDQDGVIQELIDISGNTYDADTRNNCRKVIVKLLKFNEADCMDIIHQIQESYNIQYKRSLEQLPYHNADGGDCLYLLNCLCDIVNTFDRPDVTGACLRFARKIQDMNDVESRATEKALEFFCDILWSVRLEEFDDIEEQEELCTF